MRCYDICTSSAPLAPGSSTCHANGMQKGDYQLTSPALSQVEKLRELLHPSATLIRLDRRIRDMLKTIRCVPPITHLVLSSGMPHMKAGRAC